MFNGRRFQTPLLRGRLFSAYFAVNLKAACNSAFKLQKIHSLMENLAVD